VIGVPGTCVCGVCDPIGALLRITLRRWRGRVPRAGAEPGTATPRLPWQQATPIAHVCYTGGMASVSNDLDIAALIRDTEGEILRLVGNRDPSTAGVYEMVRYHLGLDGSGGVSGKRVRPLLGLLAYASITGEYEPALPGAAAVELGHNFSLVHDDIEDGDRERRHRPTVWAVHGIPQAINTGDMLFSLSRMALHRLTDLGFSDAKVLRLMRLYDETCVALCEGQYIDIWTSEHDDTMSVELYFDMIGRKTAALIAASIEAGALLATDDEQVIARYRAFGWALGIAFQLNDDLLGIWGDERRTGKEPTDVARRKKTLPVIYAMEHAGPDDRDRLQALYAADGTGTPDVDEIVRILERTGARDYTREEARRQRDRAIAELDAAGVVRPAARERLEEIIVTVISA
jgi:geranylgeranyl diphosphate synthase, type I